MGSCKDCETTWTGQKISHCGVCHETFSVVGHFDAHRIPTRSRGNTHKGAMKRCEQPEKVRDKEGSPLLKKNEHGVWVGNTDRPEEFNG